MLMMASESIDGSNSGSAQIHSQRRFVCTRSQTTITSSIRSSSSSRVRDSHPSPTKSCSRKIINSTKPIEETTDLGKHSTRGMDERTTMICYDGYPAQSTSGRAIGGGTRESPAAASGRLQASKQANSLSQSQSEQQLRQWHHDNDNNNNGSGSNVNGGKVRLLITPATTTTTTTTAKAVTDRHGSKQQMVRSATIDSTQQQRSLEYSGSGLKNYHHYDYYTDSDLTSSAVAPPTSYRQQQPMANHYDENILLFATEHNGGSTVANNKAAVSNDSTMTTTKQQQQQQQQVSNLAYLNDYTGGGNGKNRHQQYRVPSQSHYYTGSGCGGASSHQHHHYQTPLLPTGKFVNYYPSWRQTRSPTANCQQNYSFHVPLQQQQQQQVSQCRPVSQLARYGFVAPADRVATTKHHPGAALSQAFKSRTIAHIPSMVSRTTNAVVRPINPPGETSNQVEGSSNYEDFYERTFTNGLAADGVNSSGRQYTMLCSEADLLKAHVVELSRSLADQGFDNPFKPGTELSWEADMMVRLMKRGYPVQELPVLVESAKRLARPPKTPNHQQQQQPVDLMMHQQPQLSSSTSRSSPHINRTGTVQEATTTIGGEDNQFARRRLSSSDLSSTAKQVWASSLQRAKSMPRFTANQRSADTDSLDKLITNIEQELDEMLTDQVGANDGEEIDEREIEDLSGDGKRQHRSSRVPAVVKEGKTGKTGKLSRKPRQPEPTIEKSTSDSQETNNNQTIRQQVPTTRNKTEQRIKKNSNGSQQKLDTANKQQQATSRSRRIATDGSTRRSDDSPAVAGATENDDNNYCSKKQDLIRYSENNAIKKRSIIYKCCMIQ